MMGMFVVFIGLFLVLSYVPSVYKGSFYVFIWSFVSLLLGWFVIGNSMGLMGDQSFFESELNSAKATLGASLAFIYSLVFVFIFLILKGIKALENLVRKER